MPTPRLRPFRSSSARKGLCQLCATPVLIDEHTESGIVLQQSGARNFDVGFGTGLCPPEDVLPLL